jgi:DNA-binding MarR family transcriptional regulator
MISKAKHHLGASIVHTGRLLINNINSYFSAIGSKVTFEQLEVLLHIAVNPGKKIIQNDLAIITSKNKSGILRTIDILEAKQLVKRTPVHGDRRKNMIEITGEGYKIAKDAIGAFEKIEKSYMKKINKEDVKTCNRVLDIIKDEFESNKTNSYCE